MNLLCRLGLHRWKYRTTVNPITYLMFGIKDSTRYCERCERIEKAVIIEQSPFPPTWDKVGVKKTKGVEA